MIATARWAMRSVAVAAVATAAALVAPAAAVSAPTRPASVRTVSADDADAAIAAASEGPLTNLSHLEFLLDEVQPPPAVAGHDTYRLGEEPVLTMPWTYADARDGGAFERVGGGPLDPATGYWGQGAFNADDIARAAVVYLRHWRQTDDDASRDRAYELLRSTAYLQTTTGDNAGNVVLWMQPDGTLNPSAEPVELPDPSDSGPSYWLARTIWALGEGYAAFQESDPDFAAFLEARLSLALDALERQVLVRYRQWQQVDGVLVPAWLIVDGADASAEAVLGLSARVGAAPDDERAARALRQLSEGIAALSAGDARTWPYGALLPWALSRSTWHAWGAQMPAALAVASQRLDDPGLLAPAVRDAAVFTPTLLTAGGPDNGWSPTPADRVQIAYGVDARVQSLLAVADASGSSGFADLAAMQAAWFFGANRSGTTMYDRATGVTFDGLQPDGGVNRNSGAESTIHGLLTMIALDARPAVAARATGITTVAERDGLRLVEAEAATETSGEVLQPEPWTGESLWSGQALSLPPGGYAVFDVGTGESGRWIEPVLWSAPGQSSVTRWSTDRKPLGEISESAPPQGASPADGILAPHTLRHPLDPRRGTVRVEVAEGHPLIDGLLVHPFVSRLVLTGDGRTELVHSAASASQPVRVGEPGVTSVVTVYSAEGVPKGERTIRDEKTVVLPTGGFAIVTS
ncbi:hypothetical protein [Microbacterium wangruii]|uniref:hypothetical protein n=1 Tax=Microbacterium wangruii TaxID=3049073 RepID=UPI00256F1C61|nr:hypothetical protein [Microbacterium sp. zg-Y1211]MDL5487807.1 hypothetical protein [Microbacterium sp. zg-Y1211]